MTTGNELADETPLEHSEHWNFDNGLRILFFPMISASNMIEAAPSYNRFKQLYRFCEEHYDFPLYWHIIWPRDDLDDRRYRYRWVNEEEKEWFEGLDNVELIKTRMHATQATDLGMSSMKARETFNISEGERFFDVIWNQKAGVTPTIMDEVLPSRGGDNESAIPPIVNTLQMPPIPGKRFNDFGRLRFACGIVGPNVHTVWESQHEIERTMDELSKYFNPTTRQRFREKASVMEPGIDVDYIDDVTEGVERETEPPLITFNGKIYNDRNYQEAWNIMDTAYSYTDWDIQVITPGMSGSVASSELEYQNNIDHFDIYEALPKEDYLQQSAKASIMVNSVKWTDFNQTMGEVVYTGALPVVRRGGWSELLFGEDYPFLYEGEQHGKKMLLHVIKNFDEYYDEWMPKIQERIRTKFHSARYFKEILEHWNRLREENLWSDEWYDLPEHHDHYAEENRRKKAISKALDRVPSEFTMEDFRDRFKQISDTSIDVLAAHDGRSPTPHLRYYWALKKRGVVDKCDGPRPTLDKSETGY